MTHKRQIIDILNSLGYKEAPKEKVRVNKEYTISNNSILVVQNITRAAIYYFDDRENCVDIKA